MTNVIDDGTVFINAKYNDIKTNIDRQIVDFIYLRSILKSCSYNIRLKSSARNKRFIIYWKIYYMFVNFHDLF